MLVAAAAACGVSGAHARDDKVHFAIKDALEKGASLRNNVKPDIALYFGSKSTRAVERNLGVYISNKKTNSSNKSDAEACAVAFISAAISLQERARHQGGNAVINITSVYKGASFASATEYLCGAGTIMAGVALRGTVVTLKK
ncbi:MAG TPA: excinuclease ABC subunit A [Burkholderiales bacterium]